MLQYLHKESVQSFTWTKQNKTNEQTKRPNQKQKQSILNDRSAQLILPVFTCKEATRSYWQAHDLAHHSSSVEPTQKKYNMIT